MTMHRETPRHLSYTSRVVETMALLASTRVQRRHWPRQRGASAGVTLVELVVVLAIVAVLASAAVPMYRGYIDDQNRTTAISDIRKLEVQIERFRTDTGQFPASLADLATSIVNDPWGNPYGYLNLENLAPGDKGKVRKDKNLVPLNSDYDLFSRGPDGDSKGPLTAKASRDDIVRAGNGGFVGLAEDH